ncbi:MAG: hypothetical protein IKY52_04970, partial [Clostridia bacterium]|nr:hypothetical protein [Clostridia bacterium]
LLTYEDALNAYNGVGTGDEALADADDTWWAGSNSYWGGNYSRLVTDGEYLYFNKSKSVYRYDVESGAIMSVVTPQHSFGDYFSIFGMWYDDGYLYCEMSNTPNFDGSTKANYTLSYTLSSDVHTHSFTEEIVDDEYLVSEASCTMPAVYYYSCSCGAVSPDSAFAYGEALGHSAGEAWESDESYHWHICTVCGEAVEKAVHEPDREGGATEEYAVICTECEYVIEKQLEHVHVYDREVADEKYLYAEATCISPAEYYLSCTCGEMGNRIFAYGEALGHDTADVPWYCDEEYHWRYCDRCDELADEDMHTPDHEGGATEEYAVICTVCEYVIEEQLESVKEPVQLSVSDMVIRAGQTAEMVISIDQLPTKGLGYLKLAIAYDDTILELVDAVSTDIIGTCTMSKSIDNKPFIVIWDSIDDQQETGELLRLTFRALRPESYTGTEPLVQIECREADDRDLNTVECTVGAFETELLIPGDANEDGTVNGRDLILIRQYVAEYQGITMDTRTGDVNADGVINGKDVIVMRQYLAEWGVTLL